MVYVYLFFNSLISATLFPLGSEALLLYDLHQGYNFYLLLFSATFGNTLGAVINYFFGLKGEEFLIQKKLLKYSSIQKAKNFFDKYGAFALLLSWMPIIGDPITFIAGILKYDIKKFILLVLVAKGLRYLFLMVGFNLI